MPHHQIREQLAILIGDTSYWIENATFPPDEIAIRFHHRLVFIHPFANGNWAARTPHGRSSCQTTSRAEFTWGGADIVAQGNIRRGYIDALKAADKNDIGPLLAFARY